MAQLNKYGEAPDATGPDTIIIAPVQVSTAANGRVTVNDFGATSEMPAATDTAFIEIQVSNDGFAFTTVSRIFIAGPGMILKTLSRPVEIRIGQFFRVVATSTAVGVVSGEMFGDAVPQDIVDI